MLILKEVSKTQESLYNEGKRGDRQQSKQLAKDKITSSGKGYRRNSQREQVGNLEILL